MPSLRHIKRRIVSVKNTQQITRAMKMVAAARLRRAQENAIASRPYSDKMKEVIDSLALRADPAAHPLLAQREVEREMLVVITADRGLCGGFNTNVIREAHIIVQRDDGIEKTLMTIGRKGRDFFRRRKVDIFREEVGIFRQLTYEDAKKLAGSIIEAYLGEKVSRVTLIYNRFVSAVSQEVVLSTLLPVRTEPPEGEGPPVDFIYEPTVDEVLELLLQRHIEVQLYRAMLESLASEYAARMTAMDSATKNAEEMIDNLTLTYNKARQASITRELIEVVSGADAQKG
jgi:F-type H+-transporting ATPase subunit gamma